MEFLKIKKENLESFFGRKELLQDIEEYRHLFIEAKKLMKIKGDFAELGVAEGLSAKVICEAKGQKLLHLFDTFDGLPEPIEKEKINFKFFKGRYKGELEEVRKYLKNYQGIVYHKGFFPNTTFGIENKFFSFVHLDADLQQSTLEGLKFFYPRMTRRGMIIAHDFTSCFVGEVFNDFFKDKPEKIEFFSDNQCFVRKC